MISNSATAVASQQSIAAYVTSQVGAASGSNARRVTNLSCTTAGSVDFGAVLPADTRVTRIKVSVTAAEASATTPATLTVGIHGDTDKYMTAALNDLTSEDYYIVDVMGTVATEQLAYTLAGSFDGAPDAVIDIEVELSTV